MTMRPSALRAAASVAIVLTVVLANGFARGAAAPTLGERAAAIEQASKAPDGERVVVGHLSRALRLSAETLRTQRAQTGLSWGELLIVNRLAKESGLAFANIVAEFRSGRSWEQIAGAHAVNLDKLMREVQSSQEMVEQRAEDPSPPQTHLEGGSHVPNATLPRLDPKPVHTNR